MPPKGGTNRTAFLRQGWPRRGSPVTKATCPLERGSCPRSFAHFYTIYDRPRLMSYWMPYLYPY